MQASAKLLRQWTLLKVIAEGADGITVRTLMDRLGTSEKTIRRDLAVLREVGFPVVERTADFGRKSFTLDGSAVPRLDLRFDEALALFFCRRAAEPLAGTFFWDSAQSAFRKIEASLGARAAKYVERMLGRVHQTRIGGTYADKAELIDQLLIAIEECKATFITYHSSRSSEPLTYDIHPYGLVEHRGSLYLVGHSQQHGDVRHWKVDRLEAADVTKVPFQRPADFDLAQHLAGSLGVYHGREQICVRVRFAPSAARYIREKRLHASQRVVAQRDGSCIAEWTLSSTVEAKSFILSFGAAAEVLEPAVLRLDVANDLQLALQSYGEQPGYESDGKPTPSKRLNRQRAPR